MTGCIKITAATRNGHQGLEFEADVRSVTFADRMQVLDALCRGFEISLNELKLFVALKSAGILDEATTIETVQHEHVRMPSADLLDQLLGTAFGGGDGE